MSLKPCLAGAVLSVAVAAFPALGTAAPPTSTQPTTRASDSSQEFARKAAGTDMYEIAAARIAQKRARDTPTDRFDARMIRDHSRNLAKLKSTAAKVGGLKLPVRLDEQHKGMIEQLKAAGAKQFDAVYAQQQIRAHLDAIALFASYGGHGANAKLRRFAKATLPVLEHHLQMAQALPLGPRIAKGR